MAESGMTAQEWNKKGDKELIHGKWSEAISHYTRAIKLATDDTKKGLYYDNRAAAYFGQGNYDEAIEDCNSLLKIWPNVSITLIRRLFALIELEEFEQAFQNVEIIITSCSNGTSCSNDTLPQHITEQFWEVSVKHIKNKVSQIIDLAFNVKADKEKRQNAMITLLILARWRTTYEIFIKEVGENDKVICSAIRIVDESCKKNSRTKSAMINAVLPWCLEMMNSTFTERVDTSEYCLLNVLNSGMNDEPDSKSDETLSKKHKKVFNKILSCLLGKIENETATGIARDTLIEFITRNIHYTALNWAKRLVELCGLQKLMEVASEMVEIKNKISIDITSSTQTLISMYITEIYEKMTCSEDDKKTFIKAIDDFIGDKLPKFDTQSKVRIVLAITTLMFSPLDVMEVESIMRDVLPWCLEMMNSTCTESVNASEYCLQNILNTYSCINDEPDERVCIFHKNEIDTILSRLLDKIENETTTGIARDALIEFITRNINYTALGWAKQLVEFGGLQKLMEIASQVEIGQTKHCNSLDITSSTQTITSVCLAKIDENLDKNNKEEFFNIIDKFFKEELSSEVTSNARTIVAMTTLTLGPFNVAKHIIADNGFDVIIFNFWVKNKNDPLLQKVICEFIYSVVTKYNESNTFVGRNIIGPSLTILKKLCYCQDDSIRVKALVGICKMAKFEEWKENFLAVQMLRGEIKTWMKVCRQFLISPQRDMRKWAVAGLSYLTFNLEVKNALIEDERAVQAIIEFSKTENLSILYEVDILLVNLCSAYDKEDLIPKMEMFVNYFDIKDQIKAKDSFVGKRRRVLAEAGLISALVSLAKMDSPNSKELIARVFNAICSQEELKKIVVNKGGTETLLSLALDGTDKGKDYASRALFYLALTLSFKDAFPGHQIKKVVRPILNLLKSHVNKNDKPKCPANEKHDTITVLYNLANVNDSMRKCIFEADVENIIYYCTHDNDNIFQQTSIQLINNLISYREVAIQFVEQRFRQLWYFMFLSMQEGKDEVIKKTVVEILVTLTAASEQACKKLIDWKLFWKTFLPFLLDNEDDDLQHKGTEIALNMTGSAKDVAEKLMTPDIKQLLKKLSENDTMQNKKIKELACLALKAAAEWDNIEGNVIGSGSSQSTDNIEPSSKRIKRE